MFSLAWEAHDTWNHLFLCDARLLRDVPGKCRHEGGRSSCLEEKAGSLPVPLCLVPFVPAFQLCGLPSPSGSFLCAQQATHQ